MKWIKPPDRCWAYGDVVLNPYVEDPVIGYQNKGGMTIWGATAGMVECDNATPPRCKFMTTKLNNDQLVTSPYIETIYLKYTDSNGCSNTASTQQKINATPKLVTATRTYCQDKGCAKLSQSVTTPSGSSFNSLVFQNWKVLAAPSGVNPDDRITNVGMAGNQDYEFCFGAATEDFYAGDYDIELCIQYKTTGCSTCDTFRIQIISEPIIKVSSPAPQCLNDDTLDLTKYVTVNSTPPATSDPGFSIISKNGVRSNAYKLVNGYLFPPSFGPGVWEIKYSSAAMGCTKADSFSIIVNDTPRIGLRADTLICSGATLNLADMKTTLCPSCTDQWSGPRVSGTSFDSQSPKTKMIEGPYTVKLVYTDMGTGCMSSAITNISIRTRPEVNILTAKPGAICSGDPFAITSVANFTNGVQWIKMGATDGSIDNPTLNDIQFTHGTQDAINQGAWLKIVTTPEKKEVCPMTADSIQLIINPYPVVDIKDPLKGCVPLTGDFFGTETSGIPANQLSYAWDFGNGQTSTLQNPTGITYPNHGLYTVSLTITNSQGNCAKTETKTSYIEAYPIPVAAFTTDPVAYTTIALPKFQMINQSTLDMTTFPNGFMNYNWDFGTGNAGDVSTETSPNFKYGKDTGSYLISLTVTSNYGCISTATRKVTVGPDIIVFIPNVFTPDKLGPNTNNTFRIYAENFSSMKMSIYNRWGEKLYETDDINKGWDGTSRNVDVQEGVYVYYAEATVKDGKVYKFSGTVTLMR